MYLVSQYPAINHTFILREIRELRSQGCDVSVVSIRDPDRPVEQLTPVEKDEAERTWFIKSQGLLAAAFAHPKLLFRRPGRYFAGLALALRLAGWNVARLPFQLWYLTEALQFGHWMTGKGQVHVHAHFSSTVALLARCMFPITMSITLHGPDEFNDVAGFALERKVRASLFLCAISDFARSQILRNCPTSQWRKVHVVRLGVDPAVYTPRPFRDAPRPFELMTVGRLAAVKGHAILVETVELLRRQGKDVQLRIVGDGPERTNLEREVVSRHLQQYVIFEGWLTQDKVLELYRNADVFAMSSFAEGVPVVLMEAMAMEVPCVAPCINGIPELIRDGESGLLVPPASAEKLAAAITMLIEDEGLRRRLGAAGRRQVIANYSLTPNVGALLQVFGRWL